MDSIPEPVFEIIVKYFINEYKIYPGRMIIEKINVLRSVNKRFNKFICPRGVYIYTPGRLSGYPRDVAIVIYRHLLKSAPGGIKNYACYLCLLPASDLQYCIYCKKNMCTGHSIYSVCINCSRF